jgi:tetratricopeptide (TPR) repeat protein
MGDTLSFTPNRAYESSPDNTLHSSTRSEVHDLIDQVKRADLSGLRAYLARTRPQGDWQDRDFILDRVVDWIPLTALDFACETEPDAADLFLIRASFFSSLARKKRGGGTTDKVTEDSWHAAANCIKAALEALEKSTSLDPHDPTALVCVLPSLGIFCELLPKMRETFQRATQLAPNLTPAYEPVVTIQSKRYGGSHEQSLEFARSAFAKSAPGSDMAYGLFWAHFLVYTHFIHFDKDEAAIARYFKDPAVVDELSAAFDTWTRPPYVPRRSSIPYLHFAASWFYQVKDLDRLRAAFALTGDVYSPDPWGTLGDPQAVHDRARLIAAGLTPDEPEDSEELNECLAAIALCLKSVANNDLPRALACLVVAFEKVKNAPADQQPHLKPLVMLNMSWLNQKMRKENEAAKLRSQATALLETIETPMPSARYQFTLAESLERAGEPRRAVSAWEQALAHAGENTEPERIGLMLLKMGDAYVRIGARQHAVVPLRYALEILRNLPGDPRLTNALLSLGNALRKDDPAEAEVLYREVASIHEANMKLLSATPAWANLALICSEQGRFEEALAYQLKVLKVREQSSGVSSNLIAGAHNNLANTYRRMGRFKEAHNSVDHAIKRASAGDSFLANAYDTRGQIFEDSRDDKHAAEWYRKACTERSSQASPNLDDLAESLERAVAALTRLGKSKEAAEMQQTLESVRASLASVPEGEFEETKGKAPADSAAVVIELKHGRSSSPDTRRKISALSRSLSDEVRKAAAGRFGVSVSGPENTTLIFNGKDSEFLYRVLEPCLTADRLSAGAKIVIRQGSQHRELHVPVQRQSVN